MIKLAYCDFIADRIHKSLVADQWTMPECDNLVDDISKINWDLHPEEGWMQSTAKSINVWDKNGKAYIISVQEAPLLDRD